MSAQFTEADVQLVTEAAAEAACNCPPHTRCFRHEIEARAILSALAEAGRLLPDGAEQVWGISMGPGRLPTFCDDEHEARRLAYLPTRKVFSRVAGPWVEADGAE